MNDETFWISIWGMAAAVIMILILAVNNHWKHHNELVVDMVKSGIDPIAVKCALEDDYGNHPVCLVLAAKK